MIDEASLGSAQEARVTKYDAMYEEGQEFFDAEVLKEKQGQTEKWSVLNKGSGDWVQTKFGDLCGPL